MHHCTDLYVNALLWPIDVLSIAIGSEWHLLPCQPLNSCRLQLGLRKGEAAAR